MSKGIIVLLRYLSGFIILFLLSLCPLASASENGDGLHPGYYRLKDAIEKYRALLPEGWPVVPKGSALKLGDSGERVSLLRERLTVTGDSSGPVEGDLFDDAVFEAVRRFQRRHGLDDDGVVGRRTLRELNVPFQARIRQMEINLERWSRFPNRLPERYILVNSANFALDVVENGKPVLSMLVVVGKRDWQTPSLSTKMTYIVVNPSWHVSRRIAIEELLPKVVENPNYLKEDFRLVRNSEDIDPASIDWAAMTDEKLDFKFVQRPGPKNPLGVLKFMFPNQYKVYMHDTPAKELFSVSRRAFSHGCIRLEKPVELAMYVLGLSEEEVMAEIETGKEKIIALAKPIEVRLQYWTSWADEDGTVQFREDIYGRDAP